MKSYRDSLPNFAKPLVKLALILALLLVLPVSQVLAADIKVDADCELTEAIQNANDDAATNSDCEAGSGADTITITQAGTSNGTITLSRTPTSISSTIIIEGGGFTISGGGSVQVLNLSSSGNLTINKVTITNGSAREGGGINNAGTLTINNSTISGNTTTSSSSGGGIYNVGTLTINNSTISGNTTASSGSGGGIYNVGTLTINNSTIRNNTATNGGGIYHSNWSSATTLIIRNSTISNNTASSDGGGINLQQATGTISNSAMRNNGATTGGGILVTGSAELTVTNSTIYDNTAGPNGGGIVVAGTLTLTHVTLVGNSASNAGGLYVAGSSPNTSIYNSILANNSNGDCRRRQDSIPKPQQNVGNLIGNPGDCGAGKLSADPLLGRLTGRPAYYPLLEGSPAIDAASSAHCTRKDQRGQARRITDCDIGAYEWHSGLVYVPKPPVDTILALLPEIEISDLTGFTEAQRIDAGGVGIQSVIDRGIVNAVDVWGFMGAGTRVCFLASGGSFSFLNAATSPRTVSSLPLYVIEGKTCTFIDGPGSVVLHPGAGSASNGPAWGLSNCMVTTTDVLNFRDGPGGEVMGGVPYDVTLTALSRTAGWFEVDYHGTTGWISAEYVTPNGDCG